MAQDKILIGRSDLIDLPAFDLNNIKAKIDTGAYTSAIHCTEPRVVGIKKKRLCFQIFSNKENKVGETLYYVEHFTERSIKNSFGQTEKRFIIKTTVRIFNKVIETEFSLSDRSAMKHPVLLGRQFLKEGFIVDVSRFNISFKQKSKKSVKKKIK